jgi:hypothetical protein
MEKKWQTDLASIYESLDFERVGSNEDEGTRDAKRRYEDATTMIESYLSGVITYYKQTREKVFQNGINMTPLQELESLAKLLRKDLGSFSQFK